MVNDISEVTTDKLEKYNKVQNNILDLIDEKLGNKYKQVILESGAFRKFCRNEFSNFEISNLKTYCCELQKQ